MFKLASIIAVLCFGSLFCSEYRVAPTEETVTLGLFEAGKTPVVKVKSGDIVSLGTWNSCLHEMVFNQTTPAEVAQFYVANQIQKERGMHSLTGPVYVEGAELGDILEIHILDIKLNDFGYNFLSPSAGIFSDFSQPRIQYFWYDKKNMTTEFAPGICFNLQPFPGVVAVCPPSDWPQGWPVDMPASMGQPNPDQFNSVPPGPFAGNLDQRDLQVGSVLFVPVFREGALVWTGDSHALQSNGEIDVTALETSYESIKFQFFVRKDLQAKAVLANNKALRNVQDFLSWPFVETDKDWIFVGLNTDLMEAMRLAACNAIDFLVRFQGFSQQEAYQFLSMVGDFVVAEPVNVIKNVCVHIPKAIFKGPNQIQTLCKSTVLPFAPPPINKSATCVPQKGQIVE